MNHVVDHIIGGINFRENNAPVQSQQDNTDLQHDHDGNGDGKALPESTPIADGVEAADIIGTAQRPEKGEQNEGNQERGSNGGVGTRPGDKAVGEDLLILQLRRGPHTVDRSCQKDDNAKQDQNALGNIGINDGIIAAEGDIQEHNDTKTNDRSTVRKPGGDIKKDANGGKLGYQQRDGKGNDKQRSNETGGAAFKAFFQKIRDSEKIEITGAGTEFAPQQPPA